MLAGLQGLSSPGSLGSLPLWSGKAGPSLTVGSSQGYTHHMPCSSSDTFICLVLVGPCCTCYCHGKGSRVCAG